MVRFLGSLSSFLVKISTAVAQVLLLVMTLIIVALVFSRYFLSFSFPWAEEVTRYLMVYMSLLGAAVVVRMDEHIRVNFFFNLLSKKMARIVNLIFQLGIIFFLIILIKEGFAISLSQRIAMSPSLGIPLFWAYLAIPCTAILMLIFAVNNLLDGLFRDKKRVRR